jgi:Ala-tRNA(Pro) deacylase
VKTGEIDAELTYDRLIELLDDASAVYRRIEHSPEGQTNKVSRMRGHPLEQAAKCVVVMVKLTKKTKQYVLAVVPGDKRVDLTELKALYGGTYAGFADTSVAERLSGSVSGTILPFAFDSALDLVVDPDLLNHQEIFFNAARLDLSLAVKTKDYVRIAQPRTHPIATWPDDSAQSP